MTPVTSEPQRPLPDNDIAKKQTLWLILALAFVEGWFLIIIGEKSSFLPLYQIVCTVANLVFIVRWFALDAAERRFKLSQGWIVFFVLIALLAVPYYFFKTRGARAWRPIALALLFMLATMFFTGLGAVTADLLKLGPA